MMLRHIGRHRAVGSAGLYRPGPPARLTTMRWAAALTVMVLGVGAAATSSQPTGTRALYTTAAKPQTSTITAGEWGIPTQCGTGYSGVIYGTPGDDVLVGGNSRQIILGRGGNDTIRGGNSGDCLVGGAGNDTLIGGNAKDILLGGAGDDTLDGNNGIDTLDGGPGTDECVGGHAPDITTDCESTS